MGPSTTTGSRFSALPTENEISTSTTSSRPTDSPAAARARARRKPHKVVVIASVKDAIRATRELSRQITIGVDLEGVLLSRTGTIELVQACTPSTTYLFDVHGDLATEMFGKGGLRNLLERKATIKVVHDCRHDADALFHQHNVRMAPVIDTQVAFAELRALRGLPRGLPVSLRTVLRKHAKVKEEAALALKLAVKGEMRQRKDYWAQRPLKPEMIQYAAFDVQHLARAVTSMRRAVEAIDKKAWKIVEKKSEEYAAMFRDDPDGKGPEKAARFYEDMARTAARERAEADFARARRLVVEKDPLLNFVIDTQSVVCVMLGVSVEEARSNGLIPAENVQQSPVSGTVPVSGNTKPNWIDVFRTETEKSQVASSRNVRGSPVNGTVPVNGNTKPNWINGFRTEPEKSHVSLRNVGGANKRNKVDSVATINGATLSV